MVNNQPQDTLFEEDVFGDDAFEEYLSRMQNSDEDAFGPDDFENNFPESEPEITPDEPSSAPGQHSGSRPGKSLGGVRIFAVVAIILLLAAGVLNGLAKANLYYVAAISFDRQEAGMFVGEQLSVTPELTAFGSGQPSLEWSSSDPAVASVDQTGAISALTAGKATVTVTDADSGRQAQCLVSVYAVDQMMLSISQTMLGVGEDIVISAQMGAQNSGTPEFSSSDSSVASVDASGRVTAVGKGTAVIKVTARGFSDVECLVIVMDAPTVMETVVSGCMCVGESRQMTVSMSDLEYSSAMEYSSDDPSVVTVDSQGNMKAVAQGSASVTVKAHNGVGCTLPVTVGEEPSSITVSKKAVAYNGYPLYLDVTDDTGACQEFYFTSSDPDVVRVDEDGSLHALKKGSATITCTSYNGKSAECRVSTKIVDYTTPYVSDVVYKNIAALAESYPDLITTSSIGTSVQGRDITLLTLGKGERKVLVVSGMHSRESIVVTYVMRCIEEYADAMTRGDDVGGYNVKKLLNQFTIYFVPLMNPDGMDIHMGIEQPEYTDVPLTDEEREDFKNNANGVNLNRNFPFEWGYEGVNVTQPDGRSYAGTAACSEPETRALIELCAAHDFEWMFNMHCKGHMIFYQDKVNETTQQSMNIAARLAKRCDFVLNDESTLYEISGGFENWFRREYGKAGICVEMVESKYSVAVNEYFSMKVGWNVTCGVILMCLGIVE